MLRRLGANVVCLRFGANLEKTLMRVVRLNQNSEVVGNKNQNNELKELQRWAMICLDSSV